MLFTLGVISVLKKKNIFCKKFSDWQPAKWSSKCKMLFLYVGQNQVSRQEGEGTSAFEDNFWKLSFTIFTVHKSLCISNCSSSLCSAEW